MLLRSADSELDVRIQMAEAVTQWGVSLASRLKLVEEGVVPPLVDLLNSTDEDAMAASASALEHLSHTESNRLALAKEGAISGLVKAKMRAKGHRVQEVAAATLANLAMDGQDVELEGADEDGAILRLISAVRSEESTSREYAVRALAGMAHNSKTVRGKLIKDGGIDAIKGVFRSFLEGSKAKGQLFAANSIWASSLGLLSSLSGQPEALNVFEARENEIEALLDLLERPIAGEERENIVFVLACLAGNPKSRVFLISFVKKGNFTFDKFLKVENVKLKEAALWGIARLADPGDLEAQEIVARGEVLGIAVECLKMGPDSLRFPSISLFSHLALNTGRILSRIREKKKGAMGFASAFKFKSKGGEKKKLCRAHVGKCGLEATFCLVEGEVLPWLLELIDKADSSVGEASFSALLSLLQLEDSAELERMVDYLVKVELVRVSSKLIGSSPSATKKVISLLEILLKYKKHRSPKLLQPATSALGKLVHISSGQSRKIAVEAFRMLELVSPQSSSEFP